MIRFYKNIAVVFLGLAMLTSLIAYVCLKRTFLSDALLPTHKSVIPWKPETNSDANIGGSSSISVDDSTYSLDFDVNVKKGVEFPYASFMLAFGGSENSEQLIDIAQYSTLSFNAKCSPRNVLSFAVFTFDEEITKPANLLTYRIPSRFFTCLENWTTVEIDLQHLEIPEWWLKFYSVDLSNQNYRLDKVSRFSFGITTQSPINTPSNVKISELTLHGHDWRYAYALCILFVLIWGGFALWFFKRHTKYLIADIKEKLQKDRPLAAYQQLSIEPHKDKEKRMILSFMATEYANPDMSLEMAMAKLGINRIKINEVLKEELGLTFIAYLNKLRLSEAARLLSEKGDASIAEIAYLVGYNNASYFNKLFKSEYGCAPKIFKSIYQSRQAD